MVTVVKLANKVLGLKYKFPVCVVVNFGEYYESVVLTTYLLSVSCFGFFLGGKVHNVW